MAESFFATLSSTARKPTATVERAREVAIRSHDSGWPWHHPGLRWSRHGASPQHGARPTALVPLGSGVDHSGNSSSEERREDIKLKNINTLEVFREAYVSALRLAH